MKIVKITHGTISIRKLPPVSKRRCPSCSTVGNYAEDANLNIYCKECGLIIETPYPYDAGIKHDTYCDFKYKTKFCEMKEQWKRKIR